MKERRELVLAFDWLNELILSPAWTVSIHFTLHRNCSFLVMEKKRESEKEKKESPTGGLEPPTTRLRAWRSTD